MRNKTTPRRIVFISTAKVYKCKPNQSARVFQATFLSDFEFLMNNFPIFAFEDGNTFQIAAQMQEYISWQIALLGLYMKTDRLMIAEIAIAKRSFAALPRKLRPVISSVMQCLQDNDAWV